VKQAMAQRKARHIWIEQCEAAQTVRARFGLKAAFDYLVGEKLLNFAGAASTHPEFARELPRFVSEVRRTFTPNEIAAHLAQIERAQAPSTGFGSAAPLRSLRSRPIGPTAEDRPLYSSVG
jgi:hypothetical protein